MSLLYCNNIPWREPVRVLTLNIQTREPIDSSFGKKDQVSRSILDRHSNVINKQYRFSPST